MRKVTMTGAYSLLV